MATYASGTYYPGPAFPGVRDEGKDQNAGKCLPLRNPAQGELAYALNRLLTGKSCQRFSKDASFQGFLTLEGKAYGHSVAYVGNLTGTFAVRLVPQVKEGRRKHRVFLQCPCCQRWIPSGRMSQHTNHGKRWKATKPT